MLCAAVDLATRDRRSPAARSATVAVAGPSGERRRHLRPHGPSQAIANPSRGAFRLWRGPSDEGPEVFGRTVRGPPDPLHPATAGSSCLRGSFSKRASLEVSVGPPEQRWRSCDQALARIGRAIAAAGRAPRDRHAPGSRHSRGSLAPSVGRDEPEEPRDELRAVMGSGPAAMRSVPRPWTAGSAPTGTHATPEPVAVWSPASEGAHAANSEAPDRSPPHPNAGEPEAQQAKANSKAPDRSPPHPNAREPSAKPP
jgi:hypothetical protein